MVTLRERIGLFLRQLFDSFGSVEVPRVLVCTFCGDDNKKQAPFRLMGVSTDNKPVRLLCCYDHKTAIEAKDPWIINNLERTRLLKNWSLQILD